LSRRWSPWWRAVVTLQNLTAIVDKEQAVCFVMPLNRTLVKPPRNFWDMMLKLKVCSHSDGFRLWFVWPVSSVWFAMDVLYSKDSNHFLCVIGVGVMRIYCGIESAGSDWSQKSIRCILASAGMNVGYAELVFPGAVFRRHMSSPEGSHSMGDHQPVWKLVLSVIS